MEKDIFIPYSKNIRSSPPFTAAWVLMGTLILGSFLIFVGYAFVEPAEIKAAQSTATTTVTLTVTAEISLTPPSEITMSPDLTASVNSSIGGTSTSPWNVKTNSVDGYILTLKDDSSPALATGTQSFADYATSTTATSTWDVASSTYQFGFSVFGSDVLTGRWGTGSDCGSGGTPSATLYYSGFYGADNITVATSTAVTTTSGTNTTMCVAAGQEGVYAPSGIYTTTITGTATTN